jgi:hypothetical protein
MTVTKNCGKRRRKKHPRGGSGDQMRFRALCKAGLRRTRIGIACGRSLHLKRLLSTALFRAAVQTVGKQGPNSRVWATLPAFHFERAQFSKTWTAVIRATRLVSVPLSTFPSPTVTTTKREWTIWFFIAVKLFFSRPSSQPLYYAPGIHRMKHSGDSQAPLQWCRVSQTDKGANTPCLARGLSRRDRSYREPQRWKSA